jgi:hypothetical protein
VVLGASEHVGRVAKTFRVLGVEYVAWRTRSGEVIVGRDQCPHMGASFEGAAVVGDCAVCPWHGLQVGPDGHPGFGSTTLQVIDDGYLVWVNCADALGEQHSDRPYVSARPASGIGVVIQKDARCEPRDVIANRLDPWHARWFHPYAFSDVRVLSDTPQALLAEVSYRIGGRYIARVNAEFTTPDPRTITMTIVEGEGRGSVVETHGTPRDQSHTSIIELTIATSDRSGFVHALKATPLIKPVLAARQRRLWVDDAQYAERLFAIREAAPASKNEKR